MVSKHRDMDNVSDNGSKPIFVIHLASKQVLTQNMTLKG